MNHFENTLTFHDSPGNMKRFLGLELEISDFDRNCEAELETVLHRWKCSIVGDGSINGANPFELRTAPARGEKFEQQMREICRVLRKGHAKANSTCGMHIHIDARDLAPNDLIKISTMWPHVEEAFFSKTIHKRKDSGYCQKWAKSLPAFAAGQPLIKMYDDMKIAMSRRGRFMSLNYEALRAHGTLENRIHHGTINITKILNWAKMNYDFIELCKATSLEEMGAKILSLPTLFSVEVKEAKPKKDQIIA